jgi:hypothetical protein
MNSPIVITGMGIVSPLGCGVESVWQRLTQGQSGIGLIDRFDVEDFPVKIAGQVPGIEDDSSAGFDPDRVADVKERKRLDMFTLYALAAAQQALAQAGWFPESEADREATATIIATGIGGLPTITQAQKTLDSRGYKRISPLRISRPFRLPGNCLCGEPAGDRRRYASATQRRSRDRSGRWRRGLYRPAVAGELSCFEGVIHRMRFTLDSVPAF